MPHPKLSVHSLNESNQRRRQVESLNALLDHSADDSRRQTSEEVAAGITPINGAYRPGDVRRYGAVMDGVTDDTAAYQTAWLLPYPYSPQGETAITGTIDIITDQTAVLDGTIINITGNTVVFEADTSVEWKLLGSFTVRGNNNSTGTTSGTGAALKIIDSGPWYVQNPICLNIRGHGILIEPGSSTSERSYHGIIDCPIIDGCYVGLEAEAGTGAEYVQVVSPNITRCGDTGVRCGAGNLNVVGGNITDNTGNNVTLVDGANHCHGKFIGTDLNHASTGFSVEATDVTYGQAFVGCHIYESDIYLVDCEGIVFDACVIDPTHMYFEGGQGNGFRGCTFPFGYGITFNNNYNSVASHTFYEGCRKLTGLNQSDIVGNVKGIRVNATSPGLTYTPANLTAEQTVLLTDSANWTANNTSQTLFDGYDATTGKFTCHDLGDGHVRVTAEFTCSNNPADSMLNCYMYLRKNGSGTHRWLNRLVTGSNQTVFSIDCIVEMAANPGGTADTIEFRIGQIGGIANNVTINASGTDVVVEGL